MTTPCPTKCGNHRAPRQYLCPGCWSSLPAPTQTALNRSDYLALARLRELHRQLDRGVPLTEITVTP